MNQSTHATRSPGAGSLAWSVLAIAGSLRRNSSNQRLLEASIDCGPSNLQVTVYQDQASIPLFNEDLEPNPPAAVRDLRTLVAAADGLLIAAPEYNQSIPGVLKNTLDWLSRPYGAGHLIGKPIAILGATSGSWGTRISQKELRHVLWSTESLVLPDPPLYVRSAESLFDTDGRLADERTRQSLDGLLTAFVDWIAWNRGREKE
ncbi:MAG: NAD(P)H-dependent oxidoreductase [Thermoanaerobaculia bacterium]|nr:NAD(P)H-dependent oxidoreductase [Thermoanaerobaculia bacterium]